VFRARILPTHFFDSNKLRNSRVGAVVVRVKTSRPPAASFGRLPGPRVVPPAGCGAVAAMDGRPAMGCFFTFFSGVKNQN